MDWYNSLTKDSLISPGDPRVKRCLAEAREMWQAHDASTNPLTEEWWRTVKVLLLDGNHRLFALFESGASILSVECTVMKPVLLSDTISLSAGSC
jgi:hypothetical protein